MPASDAPETDLKNSDAALREVSSRELEAGSVRVESELCLHVCPGCNTELEDRYHFDCPECGRDGLPQSSCRECGGPLRFELVRYVAHGRRSSVTKSLPGAECPACGLRAVEDAELSALAELAQRARRELTILPEQGIVSAESVEVLADADVCGPGEPEQVEKQRDGMRLRVGNPSPLFEAALSVITRHEPDDIFSPTLLLEPGPPYTPAQRRTATLLLAELQRELGAPVTCWSASVGLSEEPLVDPVLLEQLMSLPDDAGVALGLYNAIIAGRAPGRFEGSVRLLEQVLGRAPGESFAQALRRRVRALQPAPSAILQQLWLAMHPGSPFDEARLYDAMAEFQARYSAPPEPGEGARLPWEEPDFDGYAAWLRRLTSALLG